MSSWWAEKLGVARQPVAPVAPVPPPVQAFQGPVPYPGQQVFQPQYPAAPQPGQPVVQQPQVDVATYKAQMKQAMKDKAVPMSAGAALWAELGGGDAAKHESQNCPSCGGIRYFTRELLRSQSGRLMRASRKGSPAPMCMDCGYAGDYMPHQYAEVHDAE